MAGYVASHSAISSKTTSSGAISLSAGADTQFSQTVTSGSPAPSGSMTNRLAPSNKSWILRGRLALANIWNTFYRLRGRVPSHSGCGMNAVLFCQSPRAIPFKSQTTRPFRTVSSHTSFWRPSSRPPKLSTKPNFPFSILITEMSAESPTEICPRSSCLISFAGFHVERRTTSCTDIPKFKNFDMDDLERDRRAKIGLHGDSTWRGLYRRRHARNHKQPDAGRHHHHEQPDHSHVRDSESRRSAGSAD